MTYKAIVGARGSGKTTKLLEEITEGVYMVLSHDEGLSTHIMQKFAGSKKTNVRKSERIVYGHNFYVHFEHSHLLGLHNRIIAVCPEVILIDNAELISNYQFNTIIVTALEIRASVVYTVTPTVIDKTSAWFWLASHWDVDVDLMMLPNRRTDEELSYLQRTMLTVDFRTQMLGEWVINED